MEVAEKKQLQTRQGVKVIKGNENKRHGSVLVMVVFVAALLSTVVMGIVGMNTEEIQVMQNHVFAAQAQVLAEAGLNDALAQLRNDATWASGFTDKSFNSGVYTVTVTNGTIESTGTSEQGYIARVSADVTIASAGPPHTIRIDTLRINE